MPAVVSIIVPSYNKVAMIAQTIDSVLTQTYKEWELIIVDDASTDGTEKLIQSYCEKDKRIKLFSSELTKGANYARNKGIEMAQGKYLVFLDADDLLHPECLKKRMNFINSNQHLDFAVFTMQVFYKVSGDNNFCWRPSEKNALKKFLSHRLPWQTMQPIWKKDFIQKLGGFDVEFQRMQDVELHTRALLASPQFKCIDSQPDCYYRIDEERKNFAAYNFLERWVDSAVKYCNKFAPLVEDSLIKYLWGTTMATRLQLYYYLREKRINVAEYSSLKEKLGKQNLFRQMDGYHKFILSLSEMYNIRSVKIPGINWLLSKLFVL